MVNARGFSEIRRRRPSVFPNPQLIHKLNINLRPLSTASGSDVTSGEGERRGEGDSTATVTDAMLLHVSINGRGLNNRPHPLTLINRRGQIIDHALFGATLQSSAPYQWQEKQASKGKIESLSSLSSLQDCVFPGGIVQRGN